MNDIIKKAIRRALFGFELGLAVGIILMLTGAFDYLPPEGKALKLVLYMIVSGLMGSIGMGMTVVFEIESWSIARATFTHMGAVIIGYVLMGWIEGWYKYADGPRDLIITAVCIIVAYFFIWMVMYLKNKSQIRKMNEDLNEIKKHLSEETKLNDKSQDSGQI